MQNFYYFIWIAVFSLFNLCTAKGQDNLVIYGPTSSTPGSNNTFVGVAAGNTVTSSAQYNVFVGTNAGSLNSGSGNTYVGVIAGLRAANGTDNTYMGFWAGYSLNGIRNVVIGKDAGFGGGLFSNISQSRGSYNVYIGSSAGYKGYSNSTNYNVMVGDSTGYNNAVSGNVFVGNKTGFSNTTGLGNTFVGYQSGYNTTTGKNNTFFGTSSGQGNTTGSQNTFVGTSAGPMKSDGDDNVYIGYTTGNQDNGSRNTFLGTGADALGQHLTNATAIGAGAGVAISNALVLGNQANVGIGTNAPTARLHIRTDQANDSGIRLENLTSSSPALTQTDKVLSVNERGEVILARPVTSKLSVSNPGNWADRVFAANYALWPLREVATFVKTHQHLPNVPSASEVVEKGYDAATMDARLLEKVEETMLYLFELKQEVEQLRRQNATLRRTVKQLRKR